MGENTHIEEATLDKKRGLKRFKWDARAFTMIGALLFIWILFSTLDSSFLTARNLSNLFVQMSVISILAIGMVLIIVSGNIDLSVGSIVGLTGGVAAILNVWHGWSPFAVIVTVLALGAVIGVIQGWWVAYRAVPAFIVTLGGMLIFRGILLGLTNSQTISPLSPGLRKIGVTYLNPTIGLIFVIVTIIAIATIMYLSRASRIKNQLNVEPMYLFFGKIALFSVLAFAFVYVLNQYQGIPVPLLFVIIVAAIFIFISRNTVFGRHIYAIGGNKEAARMSGINIKRRILYVFILGNTMAALGGLILTARLNAATMSAGQMYEMDAIAAAVIGGTSLMGGTGSVVGAIIGALIMASLDNGMSIMNIDFYWQSIIKGVILILAVWFDYYTRNKKSI